MTTPRPLPRRRSEALLAVLAGLVAAAGLAAAVVQVRAARYAPLVQGSYASSTAPVVASDDGPERLQLPWAPGSTQQLVVSVRNDGGHPLRLEGVSYPAAPGDPVRVTSAQWAPQYGRSRRLPSFRPFPVDLSPGEEVSVQLTVGQRTCGWSPGSGLVLPLLRVRTTRWGRTHTWTVPEVPGAFAVTAPAAVPARLQQRCA